MNTLRMNKYFLLCVVLLISTALSGKEVTSDQARKVALTFLQQVGQTGLKSGAPIELGLVQGFPDSGAGAGAGSGAANSGNLKTATTDAPELYLFSINNTQGFILVSGDDATVPILGYSMEHPIGEVKELPEQIRSWIEGYQQQICSVRAQNRQPSERIRKQWQGVPGSLKTTQTAVLPLIKTHWDQTPLYNDLCPLDTQSGTRAVTGCVATALAQILKYWEYPAKGYGVHAYDYKNFGLITADFGAARYDWASMPEQVTAPNEAVATLMFHCGVAVDMMYHVDAGSGAWIVQLPSLPDRYSAESALKNILDTPLPPKD